MLGLIDVVCLLVAGCLTLFAHALGIFGAMGAGAAKRKLVGVGLLGIIAHIGLGIVGLLTCVFAFMVGGAGA